MKDYNESEFNKLCAEFFEWEFVYKKGYVNGYSTIINNFIGSEYVPIIHLKFHSDWNWIMEVVSAIDNLEFFSFDIQKQPFSNLSFARVYATPLYPYGMSIPFTSMIYRESKKEAVILVIWEFLQLNSKLKNDI
jgi:hypothetical protein